MQPNEPRSIGSALIDVYDAAVVLIRTEIKALSNRIGEILKAKGVGVLLLLAALTPLVIALIFLILTVFYLLLLVLPAWASALIVAVVSLIVAGVLVAIGVQRLTAEVKTEPVTSEDVARDDVNRAQKKLDQAQKREDQDEKKVEQAQENLRDAREELREQRSGEATRSTSGPRDPYPGDTTSRPAPTATPTTTGGAPLRRDAPSDGIPVSTKPDGVITVEPKLPNPSVTDPNVPEPEDRK